MTICSTGYSAVYTEVTPIKAMSDFHAQFRAVGTNYNQVVKELRLHFSEKKAMALLYKLEQHTVELVKLSRQIVELSREMEAKWSQKSV